MTTVAIDARKLADYGIGTYLKGLVSGLAGLETQVRFELLAPPENRSLLPGLPDNFAWTDEDSPGYSLREQRAMSRHLDRLRPDLFHSPHYVLPSRTPRRVVVTIHDLIHLVHPEFLPHRLALPYARFMLRRAVLRAGRLLTVSRASASDLERLLKVPAAKIEVIWNGVDAAFHRTLPEGEVDRVLEALGVARGYFLWIGNPKPHKNLERLLEAFRALEDPQARLVLVGAKRTAGVPCGDPKVVELGRVADEALPALYRGARALLFPSLYEGFGLPVAEAMACGTPVVASTTPAVAEIAADAALAVDPLDVDGWTKAMTRLLSEPDLRGRLSDDGLRRSSLFSWDETARRTLAVYRKLLEESRG